MSSYASEQPRAVVAAERRDLYRAVGAITKASLLIHALTLTYILRPCLLRTETRALLYILGIVAGHPEDLIMRSNNTLYICSLHFSGFALLLGGDYGVSRV